LRQVGKAYIISPRLCTISKYSTLQGQPQGLSLQTVGNEQFEDFMPLTRHRCVEVAAPYMLRVNKFVQISRADDIRSYCELFHYSLLLITLNEAKQTPQSLCDSSPFRGA